MPKKGFTLLEILISFVIFGILTAIILVGFQDSKKIEILKDSSLQLVSAIKRAQNMSSTGALYAGSFPVGGYGLHFNLNNNDRYILFADTAMVDSGLGTCIAGGNQRYDNDPRLGVDEGDGLSSGKVCAGPADKDVSQGGYRLQSGVILYKIKISGLDFKMYDIAFKPLKSAANVAWEKINITRDSEKDTFRSYSGQTMMIYLKLRDRDVCRRVTVVGGTGQVMEESWGCNL